MRERECVLEMSTVLVSVCCVQDARKRRDGWTEPLPLLPPPARHICTCCLLFLLLLSFSYAAAAALLALLLMLIICLGKPPPMELLLRASPKVRKRNKQPLHRLLSSRLFSSPERSIGYMAS